MSYPLAYGRYFVCADEKELLVYSGIDDSPQWRATLAARVTGVFATERHVFALTEDGELAVFDTAGARTGKLSLGKMCLALTGAEDGQLVAVAEDAFIRIDPFLQPSTTVFAGARAAAIHPSTKRILVGGGEYVGLIDGGRTRVPGSVVSIAARPQGFVVITTSGMVTVSSDGATVVPAFQLGALEQGECACSEDGKTLAVVLGATRVALFDTQSWALGGKVTWFDRKIGEVRFGPSPWLGVAMDLGDGNFIDLSTGAVRRTDPHEGRPRNRWMLAPELGSSKPAASPPPPAEKQGLSVGTIMAIAAVVLGVMAALFR